MKRRRAAALNMTNEATRVALAAGLGLIAAAREKAQVRLEGRDYIVQEGDVILFRHSG